MAVKINTSISKDQIERINSIPEDIWFTQIIFDNAESPKHPSPLISENNVKKQSLTFDWIQETVRGKRVLDVFCANGGFSFLAALCGAREVVGIDFSTERIDCARVIAETLDVDCDFAFMQGDVYRLQEYFHEPFDVVLCFGGLYHIADPAFILRQIGKLTREHLLLQTSHVIPDESNIANFTVRRKDMQSAGRTSIRAGSGTWHFSPACLRELLLHGGFHILEERQPAKRERQRFPWFLAKCAAL